MMLPGTLFLQVSIVFFIASIAGALVGMAENWFAPLAIGCLIVGLYTYFRWERNRDSNWY